jgi:hypothetical protein
MVILEIIPSHSTASASSLSVSGLSEIGVVLISIDTAITI